MLKVGVLGLGVGSRHVDAYMAHQHCQVSWVCDLDQQRLNEVGKKIRNVKETTDAKKVIEANDIDIISIATYDEYHFEQVEAALLAGKHVFVEKPICLTRNQLMSLETLFRRSKGLSLSANFVLRSCPLFIELKNDIESDIFGEIISVEADYLWGRKHKLESGWRTNTPDYSIVLGAGIHMIDLVVWLLEMRPITVQGMGNSKGMERVDCEFNTYCIGILKFEDGAIAKITGHGTCVHPHFHKLEVYGQKQTFLHNINGTAKITEKNNQQPGFVEVSSEEKYPGKIYRPKIINSFVDAVLDNSREPIVTARQVFDAMEVSLAIDQATNSGETVEVHYG
jgi:predicted dehydrogenase